MEINEAQYLMKELNTEIAKAIFDFQHKTKLRVNNIEFDNYYAQYSPVINVEVQL